MKKSLTKGNNFSFTAKDGFSGSCGGTPVKGYMRGGHVKKVTPHPYAKGGAIKPSDKEHKDYDDSKAKDGAVYPEVGTASKPEGYAKGGLHLHLKKGALHRELGVPAGKKIPAKKLASAAHSSNPLEAKRARLAQTMKKWKHAKGGAIGQPYEAAAKGGAIGKAHGGRMPGAVAGAKHRAKGPGAHGGMGKVPMAGPLMGGQLAAPPPPAPPAGVGGGMPQAPMMAKGGKR